MFRTWLALSFLVFEAQQVIWLRMLRLMAGGLLAERESRRMVTEKVMAAQHATRRIMLGAKSQSLIRGYRSRVRANRRRLSK